MPDAEHDFHLEAAQGSLAYGSDGALRSIHLDTKRVDLPYARAMFGLEGRDCAAVPKTDAAAPGATLVARGISGRVEIRPDGEASTRIEADGEERRGTVRVSATFSLPRDTRFHLAEYQNVGRLVDPAMPVGESIAGKMFYNFLVIETGGLVLRARTDHLGAKKLDVEILRHPDSFTLTCTWPTDGSLRLGVFGSTHDAIADLVVRLRGQFGIRTIAERYPRARWLENTRLVLTLDMMRSDGSVTHDYGDVTALAGELARIGCPGDTVLYLPGWNGPYDSGGPNYAPSAELGGEAGFRRMVDAIHEAGYRVMIHTTGWGIDPYLPEIEDLEPLVVRDEHGDLKGWQVNGSWSPPNRSLHFRTPPQPVGAPGARAKDRRSCEVGSPPVPDWCEALFTIGGLRGSSGRIRVSCGRRSVRSPKEWFQANDTCELPYPLLLQAGANTLRFESDTDIDWETVWFSIRHTFRPLSPYTSWTWPILFADTSLEGYIDRFISSVRSCVQRFGIDMVHVDAISLGWPDGAEKFLKALRDALGDTPLGGEVASRMDELGFWSLMQNATQTLVPPQGREAPREQQSLPLQGGVDQLLDWANQPSDVCDFAGPYMRNYPHLCAANAFVPVGKICNIYPPRQVPVGEEEQRAVLGQAGRLRWLPGLRLNYRQYGLDLRSTAAIQQIARGGIH